MEKIPVYDIKINKESDDETGVNLVSFVSWPAIERDFIALKAPENKYLSLNEDKQILTGAALVPNMEILRVAGDGTPYFIKFSAKTIEAIRDKFHRLKKTDQTNDEHENPLNGNFLVESWIIKDPENDKAAALGLADLPAGSWVLSFKVPDSNYWAEFIKSGVRAGFSIEGLFNLELVESELKKQTYNKMTVAEKLFKMLGDFFANNKDANLQLSDEAEKETEKLGANFGEWLTGRIDAMITDGKDAGAVAAEVAAAVGVSVEDIESLKAGEGCPAVDTVAMYSEFFGVEIEIITNILVLDGCDIPEIEAEKETDEAAAEKEAPTAEQIEQAKQADEWAKLEKAAASVDEIEKQHAETLAAKDKEIIELKKQLEEMAKKPGADKLETTLKVETKTLSKAELMLKAYKSK
jgi:hypothetical protein